MVDSFARSKLRALYAPLRRVHRPAIDEREPAARDAVDEPESHHAQREPGDENPDAEGHHDEQKTQRHPQETEPERANLPAEVRLEPRPARLAALHVVQDHANDRP